MSRMLFDIVTDETLSPIPLLLDTAGWDGQRLPSEGFVIDIVIPVFYTYLPVVSIKYALY